MNEKRRTAQRWRAAWAGAAVALLLHLPVVVAQDRGHDPDHSHAQNLKQGRAPAAVTDPRNDSESMRERAALLQRAEAELQRGDTSSAVDSFDRAAMLLHAPDTEMGLVRAYLQAGEYRRALAFCAHTAGAHREAAAPAALYAWLLQAGGQSEFAKRTLDEALARHPTDPVLLHTQSALNTAHPIAGPLLASGSHRLAPHAVVQGGQIELPAAARVVASGVLLASGQRALVPTSALPAGSVVLLRNGLGHTTQATLEQRLDALGLTVLRLTNALPTGDGTLLTAATRDSFAGSPGYVVVFSPSPSDQAAWPWLHAGFLGAAVLKGDRPLGIEVPAPISGGLVLDGAGRFNGVALTDAQGRAVMVAVSALRAALPSSDFADAPVAAGTAPSARIPADLAYERALRFSLQVIAHTP